MAQELAPQTGWSSTQTRAQFGAIAWLRWRILVNSFRRRGGTGELVGRIILYPIFAGLALLPTVGVGIGAFALAHKGYLSQTFWLLWVTFGLCQLLNIQLGQPGTTFDPTQLIRFPMGLRSFTAVRLFFGLLSPANVIGSLMSFSIALGVSIALPALWLYAFVAMAVFAATNVIFSRMIFAWVDRWLSTRRAREVFTGVIFAVSLGIQWVNFTFNPAYNRHHGHTQSITPDRLHTAATLYHRAEPFLAALPPGLIRTSLVAGSHGQPLAAFGYILACALYAALFLVVFMLRMRTEYRGESLSDTANAVARPPKKSAAIRPAATTANALAPAATPARTGVLPPALAAMLGKELLYLRRNTGIFYAVIAPVVFVFLFAGKMATRGNATWVFPAAVAYAMLGVTSLPYNSFGLEASGSQFYFLAPVNLRYVFLAKNIMNFLLSLIEIAAVFTIISYVATMPRPRTIVVVLLWATATLLLSTTLGNHRSITAPKKINLSRSAGKQASPLSQLIGMGVFLLSAAIGAGLLLLGNLLHNLSWLLIPLFCAFAAGALWAYLYSLRSLDTFAREHREDLFLELCKKD